MVQDSPGDYLYRRPAPPATGPASVQCLRLLLNASSLAIVPSIAMGPSLNAGRLHNGVEGRKRRSCPPLCVSVNEACIGFLMGSFMQ